MPESADPTTPTHPRVIVLSPDLFFGMRIRNAMKQMGYTTVIRESGSELADELAGGPASLVLIDFNAPVDWATVAEAIRSAGEMPAIAFGSHTDTDGFRQAREAGVTRVISNGAFTKQLPELVERYARSS